MFGRFMPKEGKFFDLFNAHAREIILGADAIRKNCAKAQFDCR